MYSCAPEISQAVKKDKVTLVRLLLKHGMDANTPGKSLWGFPQTILQEATTVQMIQLLVIGGANIDDPTFYYDTERKSYRPKTVLQHASSLGKIELISALLDAGANVNTPAFPPHADPNGILHGVTALMGAVEGGHLEACQLLLERGANANQYSSFDIQEDYMFPNGSVWFRRPYAYHGQTICTPLQNASRSKNTSLVRILLDYGANANAPNLWWQSPYLSHSPVNFLDQNILSQHVYPPGICTTPLAEAVEIGEMPIVDALLQAGAAAHINKHILGRLGTKVIYAAQDNNVLRKILLDAGAVDDSRITYRDVQLAVWRGDLERLHLFVASDIGVHFNLPAWNDDRFTLLHSAIIQRDASLVTFLLNNGASVNRVYSTYDSGNVVAPSITLLQSAAIIQDYSIVRLLCEAGADVDSTTEEEIYPPLQIVLRFPRSGSNSLKNSEIIASCLLDYGAEANLPAAPRPGYNNGDIWGTALQRAVVISGDLKDCSLILKLLSLGADVNADGSPEDGTALQIAVARADPSDDFKLVRVLLNFGANINSPASLHGYTALQLAVALVSGFPKMPPPQWLAHISRDSGKAYISLVLLLLEYGANVNAPGSQVADPFYANVNFVTGGRTALQSAAKGFQDTELIDLLLTAGANINAPPSQEFGRTVLQAATSQPGCSFALVQRLLDLGADINSPACPKGGVTALQGAAIQGNFKIAKNLIELGAEVNAPASPEQGRTALEGAAENGRLDMVQMLVNAGADMHLPPKERYSSAANFAEKEGHHVIAKMIRSYRE